MEDPNEQRNDSHKTRARQRNGMLKDGKVINDSVVIHFVLLPIFHKTLIRLRHHPQWNNDKGSGTGMGLLV